MLGDVLDWDTGLVLLHLIARTMGLRGSKGGQSSQKAESGQKKKGGPPPSEVGTSASPPPPPKEVTAPSHGIRTSPAPPSVAPAAPLLSTSTPQESPGVSELGKGKGVSQPVQEGIITKKADTEDNVTSQDKLASSEVVSNSCTKDTDATSLTEDSSFASCLTDPSTSLSEDGKVKVDSTSQPPVEVSQTSEAALSAKSTDDSPLTSVFKEASCLENQLRKSLVTPLGSQTKLSGDEGTPTKDDTPPSLPSPQHKASPPPERRSPPREERSAPEGTSSPTPRSNESAEHKNNNNSGRGKTSVPSGYMSSAQVEELLKQQELQFEEKLLRVELSAGEKEKQLRHSMKSEQKQMAELQGNVDELTQSRDALLKMVGQYKSMLSSLVAEKEKENATSDEKLRAVEMERNQALQDLANVEAAFSDVHRKYERTKQVVDTLRRNEETLRGAVADYETKLQKQEQKMMELQKHAEERIQQANEEYEQLRRSSEQEITKMSALLKKAEMKIISLQEGVDRKSRENQELTQLCDDLINKMGSGK